MPSEPPDHQTYEMASYVHWRRSKALEAGLTRVEADLYAESEITLQELRHLIELHCPRKLLAKILL